MPRAFVAVVVGASLALSVASTVAADGITDVIANVQVGPVTLAPGGSPTVTVTWDCVSTYALVRVRLTLTQKAAVNQQTQESSCVAGVPGSATLVFADQGATFRPGPASYAGFVSTLVQPGGDDVASVQSDTKIRRH